MTSNLPKSSSQLPINDKFLHVSQPKSLQLISLSRLLIPLLLQTGIILAAPARNIYIEFTGKTVTLETTPVNPDDILRGNHVVLDYNISHIDTLKKLPGWNQLVKQYPGTNQQYFPIAQDTSLYVIMQGESTQAWKPMRITSQLPLSLPENQVALRGQYRYGSIIYGLEKYNIPENQSEKSNKDTLNNRQIFSQNSQPIKIQIKVDARGNAVPINMQIGNGYYQF
jgi:uncharacterized membrane-anchored protein